MPTEWGSSWLFGVGPEMVTMPQGEFYRKMKKKHGKVFRLKIGIGKYIVVVADVDGAEAIIRNEGKYPSRGSHLDAANLIVESYRKSINLPNVSIVAA